MQTLDLSNESGIRLLYDVAKFFKDDKELYSLCLNRIKLLLEREIGKVIAIDVRNLIKDWENEAIRRGVKLQ